MAQEEEHLGDRVDGRTARGNRTHDAIVSALAALLDEGELTPTRARVAARAGVSLRTINLHFEDREEMLGAVAERAVGAILAGAERVDRSACFEDRLETFLDQRSTILEALTNVSRAAAVHEASSPELRRRRQDVLELGRAEVQQVFAPELHTGGVLDEELLAAADAAAGWSTWWWLRSAGYGEASARGVVRRMLVALLDPAR